MSTIEVEAFREDVDDLTAAILAVVIEHTGTLPEVDRSVIVAASLANVACRIDTIEIDHTGNVIANAFGATGRLSAVVTAWKLRGGA